MKVADYFDVSKPTQIETRRFDCWDDVRLFLKQNPSHIIYSINEEDGHYDLEFLRKTHV